MCEYILWLKGEDDNNDNNYDKDVYSHISGVHGLYMFKLIMKQ